MDSEDAGIVPHTGTDFKALAAQMTTGATDSISKTPFFSFSDVSTHFTYSPSFSAPPSSSQKKKRTSDDVNADDILGQICSQMRSLSTNESEIKQDDMTSAFMTVLDCSREESIFFLESAGWHLETAVHLWLDNADGVKRTRSALAKDYQNKDALPFERKQVFIDGLHHDWSAWISRSKGTVYFLHNPTGHRQAHYPRSDAELRAAWKEMQSSSSSELNGVEKASQSVEICASKGPQSMEDVQVEFLSSDDQPHCETDQATPALCTAGHEMMRSPCTGSVYEFNGFVCNSCQQSCGVTDRWWCSECNFDICYVCQPPSPPVDGFEQGAVSDNGFDF